MNHRSGAETLPIEGLSAGECASRVDPAVRAWRFDGFEFDLRRAELCGSDGEVIALRPKAELLLRQFLSQPGRLLSREELSAALWPAAVVTDDSLVQCVGELRAALDDRTQRLIRTLPRRGYRWEAPVESVTAVTPRNGAAMSMTPAATAPGVQAGIQTEPAAPGSPADRRPSSRYRLALAALGMVAALIGIAAVSSRLAAPAIHIDEQIAARNTVAVMPFVVSANEPDLRDTADAVADEITAQLSTRPGMRGIGRAATTASDGSALPQSRIASTRKATHVVTGRVGRTADGQRIAIDVQLSSVAEGDVIWAKHFEGVAGSGMAAAPDVGRQVVNAMRNRSGPNHRALAAAPNAKLDAVELTLLGWYELDRRKSLEDVLRARTRFEAALREDPASLIALNGLGASYYQQRVDPTSRLTPEQTAEHERIVDRIRKLAPEDSTGLMMWGNVQMMRGRADLALPAFEKASQLAPSYPNSYVLIGHALLLLGRAAEVQAVTERAVELGAGDPRRVSSAYQLAAEAALMLGDDHRAYELAGRSIAALPSNARGHAALAAIDALAGRPEQAATELAAFLKLWPAATVARYDELYRSTDPGYLHQRGRLYEGLRMAGLPER